MSVASVIKSLSRREVQELKFSFEMCKLMCIKLYWLITHQWKFKKWTLSFIAYCGSFKDVWFGFGAWGANYP